MAILIELVFPLMACGLVGWWLWLRNRYPRGRAALLAELEELRAFREDVEERLQVLETIATSDERRVRVGAGRVVDSQDAQDVQVEPTSSDKQRTR